jgi:enamine deaminase RidA (YjgF/YER057c/UK114 family)
LAGIEARLNEMGLVLPAPLKTPAGRLPFTPARIVGARVLIAGHGPLSSDGSLARPFGKVGREVSAAEAYTLARLTTLAMLASLKRAIGDLDRVRAWTRVFGMVNVAPGFVDTPGVLNGFSDLILELYGPEIGAHARSAVGMSELPFNTAVEIEAEVEIVT